MPAVGPGTVTVLAVERPQAVAPGCFPLLSVFSGIRHLSLLAAPATLAGLHQTQTTAKWASMACPISTAMVLVITAPIRLCCSTTVICLKDHLLQTKHTVSVVHATVVGCRSQRR